MCNTYKANQIDINGKSFFLCEHELDFFNNAQGYLTEKTITEKQLSIVAFLELNDIHAVKVGTCEICQNPIFLTDSNYIKDNGSFICHSCWLDEDYQGNILQSMNADMPEQEDSEENSDILFKSVEE